MDFNFKQGQTILIELDSEVYQGTYVCGTTKRIDLKNVREFPNGSKIPGTLSFYKSEVRNFRVLTKHADDLKDDSFSSASSSDTSISSLDDKSLIRMSEKRFRKLEKSIEEHVYLFNLDRRYYDLIDLINNCECVTIMAFTASKQFGRLAPISFIVIVILYKVYIIDIKELNSSKFPVELTEILASDTIKKITFCGKAFISSLHECHNVREINNVFDIEVADLFMQKNVEKLETYKFRTLSECLLHYLNIPESLIEVDGKKLGKVDWDHRPLRQSTRTIAIQHCVYLNALKDHMEKLIMHRIFDATKLNYDHYTKSPLFGLGSVRNDKNVPVKLLEELTL